MTMTTTTRRCLLAGAVTLAASAAMPTVSGALDPEEARLIRHLHRIGVSSEDQAEVLAVFRTEGPVARRLLLRVIELTPRQRAAFLAYIEANDAALFGEPA